jgi:mannose-6-phosphate isomerase class I
LMNAKEEDIKSATEELLAQVKKEDQEFAGGESTPTPGSKVFAELLPRLNGQFPGDIGLFVVFFLNLVVLQPGEAMFLQADDIHAYISGGTYPASRSSLETSLTPLNRHHGMHGGLRQRRPRWLHPQVQRR